MSKPFPFTAKEIKAKSMTVSELHYAIQDCNRAADAMRGCDPEREGWYSDERSVYAMELRRRQGK